MNTQECIFVVISHIKGVQYDEKKKKIKNSQEDLIKPILKTKKKFKRTESARDEMGREQSRTARNSTEQLQQ